MWAADLILVVEDGHIVERGTHRELLAADCKYAELHRTQFRAEGRRGAGRGRLRGSPTSVCADRRRMTRGRRMNLNRPVAARFAMSERVYLVMQTVRLPLENRLTASKLAPGTHETQTRGVEQDLDPDLASRFHEMACPRLDQKREKCS